jgi:transposase
LATKIHAVVDGLGNPIALHFTQGGVHDSKEAVPLLGEVALDGSTVLGDKAYGSKEIRAYIESQSGSYCIPPQSNVSEPWAVDFFHYKERHLVECFFQKLKNFRHIATRYDKLLSRFASFVYLTCIMILLK